MLILDYLFQDGKECHGMVQR